MSADDPGTGPAAGTVDLEPLLQPSDARLLLVVLDGLGGFADASGGTELEDADTPNFDALASEGITGLLEPVAAGITPGSGPGHLALFGYDPLIHRLGRGALTAAGIGVKLEAGDVAARGNLATVGDDGTVVDRRAGRIGDDDARRLVARLAEHLGTGAAGVEIHHVKEHRVLLVLRGALDPRVADTDPQRTGVAPLEPEALAPEAEPTARAVADVMARARDVLAGERANALLLRGFEGHRELEPMSERYGVDAAAVAAYPMYRGLAALVGMEVLGKPSSLEEACTLVDEAWARHDFVFLHYKATDAAGEDGDREAKIRAIEGFDRIVPQLWATEPDVIAVSADHATPPQLAAHSWHPVPALVWNGLERDEQERFGERWCRAGALGRRRSTELLPLMLAMGGRLTKFGA